MPLWRLTSMTSGLIALVGLRSMRSLVDNRSALRQSRWQGYVWVLGQASTIKAGLVPVMVTVVLMVVVAVGMSASVPPQPGSLGPMFRPAFCASGTSQRAPRSSKAVLAASLQRQVRWAMSATAALASMRADYCDGPGVRR